MGAIERAQQELAEAMAECHLDRAAYKESVAVDITENPPFMHEAYPDMTEKVSQDLLADADHNLTEAIRFEEWGEQE